MRKTLSFAFLLLALFFLAPFSVSAAPGFNPPASYPIRTLVLNTLGKSVPQKTDGVEAEGELQEMVDGRIVKTWKVKYEKKGHSRGQCDPPVLNVSFDKKDSRGNKRELFTGISTFPGKPNLQYQKIRLVPNCNVFEYGSNRGVYGLNGKVSPVFFEYVVFSALRAFGVSVVDVVGFADVSFMSPDTKYNDQSFRYFLLQRDNEQDDEFPFINQFNLEPPLIEDGKYERWEAQWSGTRLMPVIKDVAAGKDITLTVDLENFIKMELLFTLFGVDDRGILHNEDYGRRRNGTEWTTIPYGFDFAFNGCNTWNSARLSVIFSEIERLPALKQNEYKALYYRIATNFFSNPESLSRIVSAVDRFPFSGEGNPQLLKEFIRLAFHEIGVSVASEDFAARAGAPRISVTPLPFSSPKAFETARRSFAARCELIDTPADTEKVGVSIAEAKLEVNGGGREGKGGPSDFPDSESILATFLVDITAPSGQEIPVAKNGAFTGTLNGVESYQLNFSYQKPANIADTVGSYYRIPPGVRARFALAGRVFGEYIEGGKYTAALSSISISPDFAPLTVLPHKTNEVTAVGTSKPALISIHPTSVPANQPLTLEGRRFDPKTNTVQLSWYSNGQYKTKEIVLPSADGKTMTFVPSAYGLEPNHFYHIRLLDSLGGKDVPGVVEVLPAVTITENLLGWFVATLGEVGDPSWRLPINTENPTDLGKVYTGSFPMNGFIRNAGSADISFSKIEARFDVSPNKTHWLDLGAGIPRDKDGKLLPQRYTVFDTNIGASPGIYFFRICADPNNTITETNESDNCSPAARLEVVAKPADTLLPGSPNTPADTLQQILAPLSISPPPSLSSPLSLTANGIRGETTVPRGSRITLEWTGDPSLVSCRNNWNGKTLSPTGKTRGRITKSLTFTLFCLTATGTSVSDSVRVNVE